MRTDPAERAENAASVRRIPRHIIPPGPARDALMRLATAGYDARCYQSGGPAGVWCAWLEPLADARPPERNGRVTLAEWCEQWPALLAEMRLSDLGGEGVEA